MTTDDLEIPQAPAVAVHQHAHLPEQDSDAVKFRALELKAQDAILAHVEECHQKIIDLATVVSDAGKAALDGQSRLVKRLLGAELDKLELEARIAEADGKNKDPANADAKGILLDAAARFLKVGGDDAKPAGPVTSIKDLASRMSDEQRAELWEALGGMMNPEPEHDDNAPDDSNVVQVNP